MKIKYGEFNYSLVEEIIPLPLLFEGTKKPINDTINKLSNKNYAQLDTVENGKIIGSTNSIGGALNSISNDQYYAKRPDEKGIHGATSKPMIAYLSTYPPRACGIATFTNDLVDAINHQEAFPPPVIVAINDEGKNYDYPGVVKLQIERDKLDSYKNVAEKINRSSICALNIQHEFGLYGGLWGDYLLTFMENLSKPIVTTLHTILPDPNTDAERVLKEIIKLSSRIVVLARAGSKILKERYDCLPDKIRYIPHGCPNVHLVKNDKLKKNLGLQDRYILSTFGLISKGKGIEYVIKALPEIISIEPRVIYVVIGATHPDVKKNEGEIYRQSLQALVESLHVEENVLFIDRFLSKSDLIRILQATDTYILPYPNRDQISSGTMLYALCTGKAIVTTPFLHAEEVINQGAALRCEFQNSHSIAESVKSLIKDKVTKAEFEKKAYEISRGMIWPKVAEQYVNEFHKDIRLG